MVSHQSRQFVKVNKILLSQISDYNVAIAEEILYYKTNLWLSSLLNEQ